MEIILQLPKVISVAGEYVELQSIWSNWNNKINEKIWRLHISNSKIVRVNKEILTQSIKKYALYWSETKNYYLDIQCKKLSTSSNLYTFFYYVIFSISYIIIISIGLK